VVLEEDGETSWNDHVRNEEVLYIVKAERNILHRKKKKKERDGTVIGLVTSFVGAVF
jgi:hypothetical protein